MRIVVQYALRRATNLSEVLLCHKKKKKKDLSLLLGNAVLTSCVDVSYLFSPVSLVNWKRIMRFADDLEPTVCIIMRC